MRQVIVTAEMQIDQEVHNNNNIIIIYLFGIAPHP